MSIFDLFLDDNEEKAFHDKIDQVELEELMYDEFYKLVAKAKKIGYNEALRWRDPKKAPQDTDMLVKYTIVGDIFDYTCLEKDFDDTWCWRGEKWDVNKYPIIGWRPIE